MTTSQRRVNEVAIQETKYVKQASGSNVVPQPLIQRSATKKTTTATEKSTISSVVALVNVASDKKRSVTPVQRAHEAPSPANRARGPVKTQANGLFASIRSSPKQNYVTAKTTIVTAKLTTPPRQATR